ncbi:MAG TPA: radical SAM protein [Candidatus Hydrogenedentes bacterium]|jgi:wyosine [tRNA(Phe)-imidazoG37] synthetase (radical SAM superfamily)|nr:radical SAM protein [Candidatus Hydrogenedentota bacterium]HPJ99064.1 radical SAM protein [Candidatus Hydrogenedentota bacterium]
MSNDSYRYIFGPVVSRRLGRSLGVDVLPPKTCTYDCVYCQLGRTTHQTSERGAFVPLEDLLSELRRKLQEGCAVDFITVVGSGEPTLYSRLGEFIAAAKNLAGVPVAVITNGSLLWRPEVRAELLQADLVIPSLDAGDAAMFHEINRPCAGIAFEQMVEGLVGFRREYSGQLWLEVLLLDGVTDGQVERIKALAERIQPDRIQLNTAVRPRAFSAVRPLSAEALRRIVAALGDRAELVAAVEAADDSATRAATPGEVLNMLRRHPASVRETALHLSITEQNARECIDALLNSGDIEAHRLETGICYRARSA